MILLCDVDDTISDARWRAELIGRWDEYYAAGEYDQPVRPMIRMVNSMSLLGCRVVHLSGRPERWRSLTLSWMARCKVLTDGLLMRPDDDRRPQRKLKPALVKDEPWFDEVGLVIDDNEGVLEAFRDLGVHTLTAGLGGPPAFPDGRE